MRRNPVAAIAAAVGLCLFAGLAQAATVTVSWVHPTANTDGSALPLSAITRTTVAWGPSATSMPNTKVVTGAATSTTLDLSPGTWFIAAKTTANGNDSNYSTVVQRVIAQPTPNPPVISVTAVVAGLNMSPAYKILADGSRSGVVAGFVPTGTQCSGPVVFRYRDKDYRRVPREAVKWWNTVWTTEIAAPCA